MDITQIINLGAAPVLFFMFIGLGKWLSDKDWVTRDSVAAEEKLHDLIMAGRVREDRLTALLEKAGEREAKSGEREDRLIRYLESRSGS